MMGFYRFACGAEAAPTFPPEHGAWPRRVWHKSDVGPCTACPVADIAKPEARRSGFLPGLSVSCLARYVDAVLTGDDGWHPEGDLLADTEMLPEYDAEMEVPDGFAAE